MVNQLHRGLGDVAASSMKNKSWRLPKRTAETDFRMVEGGEALQLDAIRLQQFVH